jgi:hypothetical protein
MANNSRITNSAGMTAEDERTLSKTIARLERKSMAGDSEEDLQLYLARVRAALAAVPASTSSEARKMIITAGLSAKYTGLVNEKCTTMAGEATLAFLADFCATSPEQAAHDFRGLRQGSRSIAEWRLAVELVGARAKRWDSDIVHCFIEGLTDPVLRAKLIDANNNSRFETLNQLMPVVLRTANSLTSAKKKETAAALEEEQAYALTSPGARPPDSRTCFKCKRPGHIARVCPNTDRVGGGNDGRPSTSQVKCQICDGIGHTARACGAAQPPPLCCQWCNKNGHSAKDCRTRLGKGVNALEEKDGPLNEERDQ